MAEGGRRSSDTSVGAVKADIFTKEFAHLMFMKLPVWQKVAEDLVTLV
jgi:hypothetical protein